MALIVISLAQTRLTSTSTNEHPRLKLLGEDAIKPTLDIEPFAKSTKLGRPVAPHLFIYQPQLTWVISGAFRVTSVAITVGFYGIGLAYALLPLSSVAIAGFIHSLPYALVFLGKLALAAPISFHLFNGIRHLTWDTGSFLTLKGVYNTGYAVLGASALLAIYMAAFL
eukprot:jgi/Hompol1/4915/HPOL_001860-RA